MRIAKLFDKNCQDLLRNSDDMYEKFLGEKNVFNMTWQ